MPRKNGKKAKTENKKKVVYDDGNYIPPPVSDRWDDLLDNDNYNKALELEASKLVLELFSVIQHEYENNVLKLARKQFAQSRKEYTKQKHSFKTFDGSKPADLILVDKSMSPKSRRVKAMTLSTSPMLPRMRYWVQTERNIECPDNLRLSHIPHIDDSTDDRDFVTELRNVYTEGIHGADMGCGEYINDFMMFKLLTASTAQWKKDVSYIHAAIFKMFPNKYSLKQLEDNIFLTLRERFHPNPSQITSTNIDDQVNTVCTMTCACCPEFDCSLHGSPFVPPVEKRGSNFGEIIVPSNPCSDGCFITKKDTSKKSSVDSEVIKNLVQCMMTAPNYDNCRASVLLNRINDISTQKERSCYDWSLCAKEVRNTSEVDAAKFEMSKKLAAKKASSLGISLPELEYTKKKDQRDRYRRFRTFRSKIDNFSKLVSCNHEGPCVLADDCPCSKNELVCTKYCSCSQDCAIRFPGCACRPGYCYTFQCACFLGQWECDPDMCKHCNCDTANIKKNSGGENLPICHNIGIQLGLKKDIDIGISNVAGFGCFIKGVAEKGDLISEYTGEIISSNEAERRGRVCDKFHSSYVFLLNSEQSIDAGRKGNLIRFANHSDADANCEAKIMMVNGHQRIGIYAKRHIADGEELFFDYGYNEENKQYIALKMQTDKKKDGKKKEKKKGMNKS